MLDEDIAAQNKPAGDVAKIIAIFPKSFLGGRLAS